MAEGEFRFDKKAADQAVMFFEKLLLHSKGEWAGQPFVLQSWQRDDIIRPLFGWKRADGTRRFRRAYIEIPRKNGKALALDTPLPSPGGWVVMGDIRLGDALFDEHGQICRVTGVTEIMHNRPCYEVEFSDGTTIVADAEHEWYTDARRTAGTPGRRVTYADHIRTTEQIRDSLTVDSPFNLKRDRVEWNHRVPVAGALELPDASLPIPPYVFGVWLGDGNSAGARVTCSYDDIAVIEQIRAEGIPAREGKSSNTNSGIYALSNGDRAAGRSASVQRSLRELGVLNNKHIPAMYLRASYAQRLALLQGLMDSDGYVSAAGQCEFTATFEQLALDAQELVCSLGMKASLTVGRATMGGKDCGAKYRVQFWAYDHEPAFRLARKLARQKARPAQATRNSSRQIVAVRPVASVPVRCIEVDSPSHLYLAGATMIPTHNSTLSAGLALYFLFADGEPGAEVYCAAADRDQAHIVFDEARAMVEASKALSQYSQVFKRSIVIPRTRSTYRVLSADAYTKHGLNAHGIVFDELHAQPNRELWDVLNTSTGARRQPMMVMITTAGVYDPESICWEQHEYARQVLDGTIDDPSFFAYIAAADDDDDWADPVVWAKANPGLGVTIKLDYLETESRRAQASPAYQNTFRRLHLNQWTAQEERWLDLAAWNACARPRPDLAGRTCFGGLDLASTTDIAAFVLCFAPEDAGEPYWLLPHFWIPSDSLVERVRRDRVPYDAWLRDGLVTATPGNVIDYYYIEQTIRQLALEYDIQEIAFDRWGATALYQRMEEARQTMVQFGQGFASMSPPMKEFLKLVLSQGVAHDGNPVLRWMADNVVARMDPAGNIKPDKARSRNKIDGIVASIMALDRALRHTPSRYDTEDVREL